MVHVASSRRSRGVEAEDGWVDALGWIELFYPNFVVFIVLDTAFVFLFSSWAYK
jgi:hypothetical protein